MASREEKGAGRGARPVPGDERSRGTWKARAGLARTAGIRRVSEAIRRAADHLERTADGLLEREEPFPLRFRLTRGVVRFLAIAQSDGWGAAASRAARKVRLKLDRLGLRPWARRAVGRCPYYSPPPKSDRYDAWIRMNRDNPRRRRRLEDALGRPGSKPRFSILVPVYQPPLDAFRAMIESVVGQTLAGWELILVDDAGPDPGARREMEAWAGRDGRIRSIFRAENGNISVATNQAAAAARGEFLVFLDHDDLLEPDALAHLALHLDAHPETDLVYSDDDKIGSGGRRHSPQFKPDWSPELLLSFCYTGHLTAVRRELYDEVGGMRMGFEGSQDHDFWLRAGERARRVGHVPQVLYHWRVVAGSTAMSGHCKPASFEAGRRAVEEAFHRRGVACRVEHPEWAARAGCSIFQPVMPDEGPSVAILIPTRNHGRRLKLAIDSLARTTYRNYRVYVIDNQSDDPATLDYLASLPHRVLRIPNRDGRFSFAALNNSAVAAVEEELVVFLNDDTEVINPRWLSQMVGWSRLPGVGAVGARLLFPDRRIQHAGIVHGLHEGLAGHAFRLLPWWDPGSLNLARVARDCLAVTAACMLTPRRLFLDLGGFDEVRFAVAYNDADYGYRLVDAGYRCVYCAEAELFHHEGLSRGHTDDPREVAAYREVHGHRIDPYFNPHLDPELETFQTKPTVVPLGAPAGRIPLLAVSHGLNWEGAPRFQLELLTRLKAAGAIDPIVLSPYDGPIRQAFEQAGIAVRVEPSLAGPTGLVASPRLYRDSLARVARLIQAGEYEVVHANTLQTFWAVEAARAAGIPSVWSVHESEPWKSYFDALPRENAAAALACLAYPYRVVFTAQSSARVWSDLDSSRNFGLIRFAFDTRNFRAELEGLDRDKARRDLGVVDDEVCVLLLGTVCERKGQQDLVRAFATLPPLVAARMKCLVVGARDSLVYSRRLRTLAGGLPADRRDRFVIVPETGATAPFWWAADVFCCTSRIESYPRVVLEAMAAGLPLITTPVFGIAEQVRPSFNALIYEPGDIRTLARHLLLLARDEARRRSFAERSRWILQSLPGHARMDEQYRRTFQAAAESAPPGTVVPPEVPAGPEKTGRHRAWFADAAVRLGASPRSRPNRSPVAR
jgi:GT2 family glycosyltransferase/glycosyltransferase involved in cell wall biosynthesis